MFSLDGIMADFSRTNKDFRRFELSDFWNRDYGWPNMKNMNCTKFSFTELCQAQTVLEKEVLRQQ